MCGPKTLYCLTLHNTSCRTAGLGICCEELSLHLPTVFCVLPWTAAPALSTTSVDVRRIQRETVSLPSLSLLRRPGLSQRPQQTPPQFPLAGNSSQKQAARDAGKGWLALQAPLEARPPTGGGGCACLRTGLCQHPLTGSSPAPPRHCLSTSHLRL